MGYPDLAEKSGDIIGNPNGIILFNVIHHPPFGSDYYNNN